MVEFSPATTTFKSSSWYQVHRLPRRERDVRYAVVERLEHPHEVLPLRPVRRQRVFAVRLALQEIGLAVVAVDVVVAGGRSPPCPAAAPGSPSVSGRTAARRRTPPSCPTRPDRPRAPAGPATGR